MSVAVQARAPMANLQGIPDWHVLSKPSTQVPSWLQAEQPHQGPTWWRGVASYWEGLLARCPGLAGPNKVDKLLGGLGVDVHPTQPALHTKCIIPRGLRRFLQGNTMFREKKVERGACHTSKSSRASYLKLKKHGFSAGEGLPPEEIYFHWVPCYMYRGPPEQGTPLRVVHLCENKLCLAPWHMDWGDQSRNMKGYHVHKRHRAQYNL